MEVSEDQLQLSTLESDLIIDQCQMSSKQHLWRMVFTTVQKVLHEIGSDATDTQVVEAVWFELGRDDLPDSTIREAIAFAKSQSPSTQPSQGKQGELPKALPSNSQGLYSSPPHNQQSMDMMGSPAQQESVHATPWRLRGQQQTITDKSNLSNLVFSTPPPGVSQIGSTLSFETSSLWFDSEKTRKNTIYSNFSTPMRLSAAFSLLSNSIDSSGSSRFSQEQQSPLHATGFSIPHENSFDQINNKRFFEFSLDHLNYCYGAVAYYLTFEKHLPYPNNLASSRICFIVEWRDIQYKVIGHAVVIPPISLRAALGPFAVQAALQAKASLETLNKMTLRITEISYLRIIKDVSEWIFEEQGIIIYFDYEGNRYSSVLMPSTINFSKWSKNEAVIEAVRRSKFFGRIELVLPRVRLIAFKTNFILFRNTPSLKVWRVPSEKWSHGHILKLDHK